MELILISNSKLKITLTADEVKRYDVDRDGGRGDMRRAMEPVLLRAREMCGFDASAGRVFIQLFPSREGGCEMFVTRLERENDRGTEKDVKDSRNGALTEEDGYFAFRGLRDLIGACRILKNAGAGDGSVAYVNEDGVCFLTLPGTDGKLPFALAAVGEFGERVSPSTMKKYLPEHCRRLVPTEKRFGDDVSILADF